MNDHGFMLLLLWYMNYLKSISGKPKISLDETIGD